MFPEVCVAVVLVTHRARFSKASVVYLPADEGVDAVVVGLPRAAVRQDAVGPGAMTTSFRAAMHWLRNSRPELARQSDRCSCKCKTRAALVSNAYREVVPAVQFL